MELVHHRVEFHAIWELLDDLFHHSTFAQSISSIRPTVFTAKRTEMNGKPGIINRTVTKVILAITLRDRNIGILSPPAEVSTCARGFHALAYVIGHPRRDKSPNLFWRAIAVESASRGVLFNYFPRRRDPMYRW
jgi:hypothetical protein